MHSSVDGNAIKTKGFTLIELMLVVAIIGLLAAIAIPKFANLVIKAKEAAVRGKLGSLRSAVSIYYADNEGFYPVSGTNAMALTIGSRYLQEIPRASIPTVIDFYHTNQNFIGNFNGDMNGAAGTGFPWGYSNGFIGVNCTHTDTKGTTWSQY